MLRYHQRYLLTGHTKPSVRANKQKSSKPEDRAQWAQYRACLEDYGWQALQQRRDQGSDMLPKTCHFLIILRFYMHTVVSCDMDNLLKTVLDSMSKVVYADDRYGQVAAVYKFLIPKDTEEWVNVEIVVLN